MHITETRGGHIYEIGMIEKVEKQLALPSQCERSMMKEV